MGVARTVREQITDRLRSEVVAGRLPAGEALRESELASRYGVSRGPIRDAFLQLSQEGLLSYHANRGVTVCHPPLADDRDFIVQLRRQVECFVVTRGLSSVGEAGLAQVTEALGELDSACKTGESVAVAGRDAAFHEALLTACGGNHFLPAWRSLCSQMHFAYSRLEDFRAVFEEHRLIFEALRAGKKTPLIAALKANIR